MFGFGWVMNYLIVVFGDVLDYFGVFGWISGKRDEIIKIWANFGVLRRGIGIPCSSIGPHQGVARCSVAKREAWTSLGYAKA